MFETNFSEHNKICGAQKDLGITAQNAPCVCRPGQNRRQKVFTLGIQLVLLHLCKLCFNAYFRHAQEKRYKIRSNGFVALKHIYTKCNFLSNSNTFTSRDTYSSQLFSLLFVKNLTTKTKFDKLSAPSKTPTIINSSSIPPINESLYTPRLFFTTPFQRDVGPPFVHKQCTTLQLNKDFADVVVLSM